MPRYVWGTMQDIEAVGLFGLSDDKERAEYRIGSKRNIYILEDSKELPGPQTLWEVENAQNGHGTFRMPKEPASVCVR